MAHILALPREAWLQPRAGPRAQNRTRGSAAAPEAHCCLVLSNHWDDGPGSAHLLSHAKKSPVGSVLELELLG